MNEPSIQELKEEKLKSDLEDDLKAEYEQFGDNEF